MKTTAELGTELFVQASRFARNIAHASGSQQPSVVWRVMSSLDLRGALRASQLAELERVSQPSISVTLQRLERLGYVSREPDPTDNRAVLFRLEPLGTEVLGEHRAHVAEYLAPHLDTLNDLDRAAMTRVCEIMGDISSLGLEFGDPDD